MGGIKLMSKGFYHSSTGYWETISEPSDEIIMSYPEGTIEVDLKPGPLYSFDGVSWIAPTQEELDSAQGQYLRDLRDQILLLEVDPIVTNSLRWNDLSEAVQAEYAAYRRALLDITDQVGFPHDVVWPTKPE